MPLEAKSGLSLPSTTLVWRLRQNRDLRKVSSDRARVPLAPNRKHSGPKVVASRLSLPSQLPMLTQAPYTRLHRARVPLAPNHKHFSPNMVPILLLMLVDYLLRARAH